MIEDFLVAIRAATLGQSVALLPRMLVQDELSSGALVEFSPTHLDVDHTYHLAHTTASVRRPYVQSAADWLKASLEHLN